MLLQLTITNIAIIDRQTIEFGPGLSVITGETGAGKSILIDALGLVLGARADPDLIRGGEEAARVECVFTVDLTDRDGALTALLEEQGIELDEGTLILARDLQKNGRSIARVNGRTVVVSVLQRLGQRLVDIHGQSDHLSLLRPGEHIEFLDRYGVLLDRRAVVAEHVAALARVRQERRRLHEEEHEAARRIELLQFQAREIAAAGLQAGEQAALEDEIALLSNAEQRARQANRVYEALEQGTAVLPALTDLLGQVVADAQELSRLDVRLSEPLATLEGLAYQVEDVARTLRAYRDGIEFNPARLQAASERLEVVRTLVRKYGGSIEAVLQFAAVAEDELETLTHRKERLASLDEEEQAACVAAGAAAWDLSQRRAAAALDLAQAVVGELAALNMPQARFEVGMAQRADPEGLPAGLDGAQRYRFDTTGVDTVEFHMTVNPGEPLRPLAKVASGGETSRIMLALKTVLGRASAVETFIFDEVDAGLGGQASNVVGQKLSQLGTEHQVITITHLPQIAAYGNTQFAIAKREQAGRTTTEVRRLRPEERVDEIARMIGGTVTRAAHQAAEDLLHRAQGQRGEDKRGPATTPGTPSPQATFLGDLLKGA